MTVPPVLQTLIRQSIQDVIATIQDQSNRSPNNVYTTQLNPADQTLTIKLNGVATWKITRYGIGGSQVDSNPSHDFVEVIYIGPGVVCRSDAQLFLQGLT